MDMNYRAFSSWSGGKDSCLALYKAQERGIKVEYLLTMFTEDGTRSRGHGLRPEIFKKYAELLNMDYIHGKASWGEYEKEFKDKSKILESKGINMGIFGDVDLIAHKEWIIKTLEDTNIEAFLPLWGNERTAVIEEFINLGFKSIINTVNGEVLSKEYLGRIFDHTLIKEFDELGVDPCGESGEFHTVVVDGPIFKAPLKLQKKSVYQVDQYWMLDLELTE